MIRKILGSTEVAKIGIRYLLDRSAPYLEHPLIGDSSSKEEVDMDRIVGEMEHYLPMPEIPAPTLHRIGFLAENLIAYLRNYGVDTDSVRDFREYVDTVLSLDERAEVILWETSRILAEYFANVTQEVQGLVALEKRLQMNLNIYREIKLIAISGGPASYEELEALESALKHQIGQARRLIAVFHA